MWLINYDDFSVETLGSEFFNVIAKRFESDNRNNKSY